ncbi:MAG: hypothetical protein IJ762_07335 [Bacteroidaceae bacterium]|nr:hypothetical protein [Bacteroidaceae bacterium]
MDKEKKCPYCGCKNVSKTASGWAESAIKGTGALALAFGVGIFSQHHGHHLGTELSKEISSEYECKKCGKKFRYSDERGSYRH